VSLQVVIKAHVRVKARLEAWVESTELAKQYWTMFESRIREAQGPPEGARLDDRTSPPTYWVDLTGDMTAQLVVLPDRRKGFFGHEREVVILSLVEISQAPRR
jgi:hypothetical protein